MAASIKVISVWEAHVTVDDRGGLGDMIGVFSSKPLADEAVKGRGWYGGDGRVTERRAIDIGDGKVYLLADTKEDQPLPLDLDIPQRKAQIRREALAALTPEQRRVLNLPDK
jgi:hypothetical protein